MGRRLGRHAVNMQPRDLYVCLYLCKEKLPAALRRHAILSVLKILQYSLFTSRPINQANLSFDVSGYSQVNSSIYAA